MPTDTPAETPERPAVGEWDGEDPPCPHCGCGADDVHDDDCPADAALVRLGIVDPPESKRGRLRWLETAGGGAVAFDDVGHVHGHTSGEGTWQARHLGWARQDAPSEPAARLALRDALRADGWDVHEPPGVVDPSTVSRRAALVRHGIGDSPADALAEENQRLREEVARAVLRIARTRDLLDDDAQADTELALIQRDLAALVGSSR
jgi:hypothetical protein